jgi:hypothetical protein
MYVKTFAIGQFCNQIVENKWCKDCDIELLFTPTEKLYAFNGP